jgi:intracellular multiplication protein IcmL
MSEEELEVVRLRTDFYRDGFRKIIFSLIIIIAAILTIIGASIYLYVNRPKPVTFKTYANWRLVPAVPLQQPYLSDQDLKQWVSNVLQEIFVFDFYHYPLQLKDHQKYFTENGARIYIDLLNNYAEAGFVTANKIFTSVSADEAPFILDRGILPDGRYAWWITMKIKIDYVTSGRFVPIHAPQLRVLVVRAPNVNNLSGVAISKIINTNAMTPISRISA